MNKTVSKKNTARANADAAPDKPADSNTLLGTHPRPVFICSPYRPTLKDASARKSELDANIDRAKRASRIAVALGFLPLAPHLYFTGFLDDNDDHERETGMRLGMQWLEEATEVWVIGDKVSAGMKAEIRRATELGKNVRRLPEPGRIVELLLKELARQEDGNADKESASNESADKESASKESAGETVDNDTQRRGAAAESEG